MESYELLPHTADVALTARGSTREDCLGHAVACLTSCFADTSGVAAVRMIDIELSGNGDADLLARLLEEVLYLADTQDVAVVATTIEPVAAQIVWAHFAVVPLHAVQVIGPAPKGVSRNGLRLDPADTGWQCAAIIDV